MDPSAPPHASPGEQANLGAQHSDDYIFNAFDTYPWAMDPKFMSLITSSLLKPGQTPDESRIRQVRSIYFTRILGLPAPALPQYQSWLAANPSRAGPDASLLSTLLNHSAAPPSAEAADANKPAWQSAAPKADLFVDRAQLAAEASEGGGPAYPARFAELIRCIKEGLPVPGIREIPETLVRDPSAKPFGARPAPRKPWEKDIAPVQDPGDEKGIPSQPAVDHEFPPLDPLEDGSVEQGHTAAAEGSKAHSS